MDKKLFCFLDVLGFSSLVSNDEYEVSDIFNRLQLISDVAITDQKIREARKTSLEVSNPNCKIELSGLENYQWGSDSMFAYGNSDNCDLCIFQIAHFIYESLQQSITYFPKLKKEIPLLLLRGGIALGEVNAIQMPAIFNKKIHHTINVFGKAVLKATSYEKQIKGPRVFLDDIVYSHLYDQKAKELIIHPYDISREDMYELLWPMIAFSEKNLIEYKSTDELNILNELLGIAAYYFDIYKSKKGRSRDHFDEFVCLILRSAKQFYTIHNRLDLLNDYIEELNSPSISVPIFHKNCSIPRYAWTECFKIYVINMFKKIVCSSC